MQISLLWKKQKLRTFHIRRKQLISELLEVGLLDFFFHPHLRSTTIPIPSWGLCPQLPHFLTETRISLSLCSLSGAEKFFRVDLQVYARLSQTCYLFAPVTVSLGKLHTEAICLVIRSQLGIRNNLLRPEGTRKAGFEGDAKRKWGLCPRVEGLQYFDTWKLVDDWVGYTEKMGGGEEGKRGMEERLKVDFICRSFYLLDVWGRDRCDGIVR